MQKYAVITCPHCGRTVTQKVEMRDGEIVTVICECDKAFLACITWRAEAKIYTEHTAPRCVAS